MDEIVSIILIFGILGIVGIFAFYIFKTYVMPKKVEELAEMIKSGQIGPAIKKLQSLVEEDDRNPYTHMLLGEAYNIAGNIENAIVEFKKVLKIGKFGIKVKEQFIRGRLAKLFLKTRNLDDAKKEFLILTKLEPTNADNFYQAGLLFDNAGLSDKALPYFKQTVKINKTHADAYNQIGKIEYMEGNIPNAKLALTEAVKVNPNLYKAHYYLGLCLKNQKDYDWALKEFQYALKNQMLAPKAQLAVGLCYLEREQPQKAIPEFEKGLNLVQKGSEQELNMRYFLANSAEMTRDFHTAISNWERIHDVNPKFKDVDEKLKTYEEFRTDDSIKDFMIAIPGKFEAICRKMIEQMDLSITNLEVISDSEVHALTTEMEGKWRNTKRSNRVIYIFRTTDPIQEKELRQMHEDMRSNSATRGYCMTTSEFTSQSLQFCQSRPIDLIDKKELIKNLRAL